MILCDVNILLYAHKSSVDGHAKYRAWLEEVLSGEAAYGMSELVVSGFIRIATHPRIFAPPSTPAEALAFAKQVLGQPQCVRISPGPRHWEIFTLLLEKSGARGNLVPDAYLAALAIESGCEWITTDRDYARFEGLTWRSPFEPTR